MPDNSVSPDDINSISTLISVAAIAYRARRPFYEGPHYPIPPWRADDSSPLMDSVEPKKSPTVSTTPFVVIRALVEGRLLLQAWEACCPPPEFEEAWSDDLEAAYDALVEQGDVP